MASITYPTPPITEAVIEIKFENNLETSEIERASSKIKKNYSQLEHQENRNFFVDIIKSSLETSIEPLIRLSNADQDEIFIISKDKIVVSKLAVYDGWDIFRKRFERDWSLLKESLGYRKIIRLGVRYINRIDVPPEDDVCHYEQYLNLHVNLPEFLDPTTSFSLRTEKQFEDPKCLVAVSSSPTPSPFPKCGAFLLDIDVGCTEDLPQRDNELLYLLDKIRHLKNNVFEACITDLSRERLKDGLWLK